MARLNAVQRRTQRVRRRVKFSAKGKPRLSVFRSGKHMYAQVIDDINGVTVASASTVDKDLRSGIKNGRW
jgi:large subunit ribosomal protein L18